jgi:hypothetical protein
MNSRQDQVRAKSMNIRPKNITKVLCGMVMAALAFTHASGAGAQGFAGLLTTATADSQRAVDHQIHTAPASGNGAGITLVSRHES